MIEFHDKSEIQPLPAVPKIYGIKFKELVDQHINGKNKTYFEILGEIYNFLTEYGEFVKTFSVCQRKCNHCCRNDVYISQIEAEYIGSMKKLQINTDKKTTHLNNSPCPFLDISGDCSVYDYRPFNCRTFHTLDDPKYCESGENHQTYGSAGFGYGVTFYSELARWIKELHEKHKLPYRDIRDWFPQK